MKPMRLLRGKHRQRGQVMLVAVTIMIILLVIGLFVFDLSSVVRLRAKTQTGSDSAAVAGAAWQGRTLNMIGEINLIKASTVLVSDVPPFGDDSASGLLESADAMSQMQVRISYAGPLLGLSAMQQAAKQGTTRHRPQIGECCLRSEDLPQCGQGCRVSSRAGDQHHEGGARRQAGHDHRCGEGYR